MSWLVETLLLNRETLKTNPDFNSDDYNNVLIIEKAITDLIISGNIAPFELALLNFVISNQSYTALEKVLGVSRNTISRYFRGICDKISYYLGSEFTDEGYLAYMQEQYKLTDKEVNKMRRHIKSRYRHSIRRNTNE